MRRTNRPSLNLLKEKKDLIGAEIGVQAGVNAKWILENLDIKKLYLIDPYAKYPSNNKDRTIIGPFPQSKEKAIKNLKGFEDKIEWVYKFSWDAIDDFEPNYFDFVYIDGDHRTSAVLKDLQYASKIKLGGLLCGHDWRFQSVKRAMNQFSDQTRIKFNCCNTDQYVKTMDKQAAEADWWIWIPEAKTPFEKKCSLCQNKFHFTTKDIDLINP